MTRALLGMELSDALQWLAERGILDVRVEETGPPRAQPPCGGDGRGRLRVVRVKGDGRALTVARFPDEVERSVLRRV